VRVGGPPASVTATRTVSAGRSHVRQHLHSTISPSSKYQEFSSILQREDERSKEIDDQLPCSPGPGGPDPSVQSPLYPPFNADTTNTSSLIRETTPQRIGTDVDTVGTLTFSPSTKLLLESCKTDRGRFLREIEEARTALPTGQGWEAAIATKENNADMRDRNKIYHRFECYNIYKHVVEAGYHTGTHWIRDMRMALVNKLCQEFPQRFPDEKAANKGLNWVDQGCKYHEWAGQFISEGTSLGHLIALPLDVPHSTYAFPSVFLAGNPFSARPSRYTSRCTQKRMRSIAIQLHNLRIDDLVKELELDELGDHIAATLRDMTGRKRKDIPGKPLILLKGRYHDAYITTDGSYSSQKLPRLTSCRSPRHSLSVQSPDQNPTPPASLAASWDGYNYSALEMDYAVDSRPFDQSTTSLNVCRSIAETYAVPYNSPLNLSTYDLASTLVVYAN